MGKIRGLPTNNAHRHACSVHFFLIYHGKNMRSPTNNVHRHARSVYFIPTYHGKNMNSPYKLRAQERTFCTFFPNLSREKYEFPLHIMCTGTHVLYKYFSENVIIVKERLSSTRRFFS